MKSACIGAASVAALACSLLVACGKRAGAEASDPAVHTLVLPSNEPPIVEAPGKSEFVANCRTCHSARYLADQPRFSRKTWTAEVEKMRASYGAPIPPEHVAPIVDYLVAVNGTPD